MNDNERFLCVKCMRALTMSEDIKVNSIGGLVTTYRLVDGSLTFDVSLYRYTPIHNIPYCRKADTNKSPYFPPSCNK